MSGEVAPIIIKRVNKVAAGHHGGTWKIAYADFVTAMMAFFLLLWLLSSTSDEQKAQIADYFKPTTVSKSQTASANIIAGLTLAPQAGAGAPPLVVVDIQPPPQGPQGQTNEAAEAAERLMAVREQAAFEQAEQELQVALESNPVISSMRDNIIIDMTPDGMRIQLVDKDGESLFRSGSAEVLPRTRELIREIATVIASLPNNISISGHTDSAQFSAGARYTNWELSADRANASRRTFTESGIPIDRITEVVGKADIEPLTADPLEPENRRISIVLKRMAHVLPPNLR